MLSPSARKAIFGALLTTTAQLSKLAVGIVFVKLIATYLGVEGLGQLGNFMSATMFISLLAGGGIQNGMAKYVAEYRYSPEAMHNFLRTAKSYVIIFSTIYFLTSICFAQRISEEIFDDADYYGTIILLGTLQFFYAFTNASLGVIIGFGRTRIYASIQIIGNLIFIPTAWLLVSRMQTIGAILAIMFFYGTYFLPTLVYYIRSDLKEKTKFYALDFQISYNLLKYSLMAIVSAASVPLVEIVVRNYLIKNESMMAAGLWQAATKLSSAYMGFFVLFLAVYYLPAISSIEERTKLGSVVLRYMVAVIAIFSLLASIIYIIRDTLIPFLLSSEFKELSLFLKYQLIGDFFRITTYVIAFVVVAKAATKTYIILEICQGVYFSVLSVWAIKEGYGVEGVFVAHMIMNITYFLFVGLGFFIYLRRAEN